MYPLAHMYMLNKLVNKVLGRHLREGDAEQAMGVWLLDAIVTQPLRAKLPAVQGVFHSLDFDVKDPLQAGMKIHVYCDNLANFGTLEHEPDKKGQGFLSKREEQIYVPGERKYAISDDFRRRLLQCGIDMLVVREDKDALKQFFDYATVWARKRNSSDRIYSAFVELLEKKLEKGPIEGIDDSFMEDTLKNSCESGLLDAVIKYSHGIDYMMTDWRRAKVARDKARKFKAKDGRVPDENYCRAVSVENLIKSNFKYFAGWQKDVDKAVGAIIDYSIQNPETHVLQTFSR